MQIDLSVRMGAAGDVEGQGSRNLKEAGLRLAIQPILKEVECNEGSASLILELPSQLDPLFRYSINLRNDVKIT